MNKILFILIVLSLLSCGNQSEIKVLSDVPIRNKNIFVDTVFSFVKKPDTITQISKNWQSVYYIKNNDTIFSDVPFEITFKNDSNNLTFVLDGSISKHQKWDFMNGLLTTNGIGQNCYEIISLSDSTLRTRDTSKLGFEYFFKTQ